MDYNVLHMNVLILFDPKAIALFLIDRLWTCLCLISLRELPHTKRLVIRDHVALHLTFIHIIANIYNILYMFICDVLWQPLTICHFWVPQYLCTVVCNEFTPRATILFLMRSSFLSNDWSNFLLLECKQVLLLYFKRGVFFPNEYRSRSMFIFIHEQVQCGLILYVKNDC